MKKIWYLFIPVIIIFILGIGYFISWIVIYDRNVIISICIDIKTEKRGDPNGYSYDIITYERIPTDLRKKYVGLNTGLVNSLFAPLTKIYLSNFSGEKVTLDTRIEIIKDMACE